MFEQVKIILINTTHPGNIGAVARAMKNMGFHQLCLVSPKIFPSEEAWARAAGAEDILVNASVVHSLDEALAGCHWIFGLSARLRKIPIPVLTSRAAAIEIAKKLTENPKEKIAVVFGQEQSGLLNEALAKCHFQILIPADALYASLNVAQAVQIMVYELRMAWLEKLQSSTLTPTSTLTSIQEAPEERVAAEAMEGFYTHLEEILIKIQFLDPQYPGYLMRHLRRLFAKSSVTKRELNILRGILTALEKRV